LTFTFWNSYVLELLRLETLTFSDVTLSDINVVCVMLRFVAVPYSLVPRVDSGFFNDLTLTFVDA
jgi:hypothetical protein